MTGHRAFTIVELLVATSIIAMLIGILLPAIGKARDQACLMQSQCNLHELGRAHATYAADWSGRQFTLLDDNLAHWGASPQAALDNFEVQTGRRHPSIRLGWMDWEGSNSMIIFPSWWTGNQRMYQPIAFGDGVGWATGDAFGWFRIPNARQFSGYLSGRWYDPVFYAPKDRMVMDVIGDCIEDPGEFSGACQNNVTTIAPFWSSYCLSPAALYSPDVFRRPSLGGWQDPWTLESGLRVPAMSQARYPDLKTHMLEHHWLQQSRADCNPAFDGGTYEGCEPYYFNHGRESVPVTLFFDGHVRGLGVREAEAADARHRRQSTDGLWSRDTPLGENGYLSDAAYDLAQTSFHILTTEGIRGRDTLAR
ncbi:MAG: type II secretion system protein [Planctomycetota bacterium]|jgi:prepilin-type N-terminal cleavage/methylation domain-containing protein